MDSEYGQSPTWVDSLRSKLGELEGKVENLSIFRVPSELRKLNEDAYKPSMVSIGPFHHNTNELQWMEGFKWQYTLSLLRRTGHSEAVYTFEKCAEAIRKLEDDVRGYYTAALRLNPQELKEILMVDGCFILELLIRYSEGVSQKNHGDPIISNEWVVQTLQHDLALLENQIPIIVLQKLFDIIKQCLDEQGAESLAHPSITAYALLFFHSALGWSVNGELGRTYCDHHACKHLLDVLHKFCLPAVPHQTNHHESTNLFRVGATELLKAGVRIEVDHQPNNNLLDVKFDKKDGVLTFPTSQTVTLAESILSNLIAYEQGSVGSSNQVTSYARLIGSLIRNRQDIDLLKKKGVIVVPTSSSIDNEIVTNLFLIYKDFPYGAICDDVNEYRTHWLNWGRIKASLKVRWRGYFLTLRSDYFTNPWTTLSVIAAVTLLILTVLQTVYTVRSYYPR